MIGRNCCTLKQSFFKYDLQIEISLGMNSVNILNLYDYLKTATKEEKDKIFEKMGKLVSRLHNFNRIHGDMIIINFVVSYGDPIIIDHGHSFNSSRDRDKAMDLYIFYESLIFNEVEEYAEKFYSGYENKVIIERLKKMRVMEENRKKSNAENNNKNLRL